MAEKAGPGRQRGGQGRHTALARVHTCSLSAPLGVFLWLLFQEQKQLGEGDPLQARNRQGGEPGFRLRTF